MKPTTLDELYKLMYEGKPKSDKSKTKLAKTQGALKAESKTVAQLAQAEYAGMLVQQDIPKGYVMLVMHPISAENWNVHKEYVIGLDPFTGLALSFKPGTFKPYEPKNNNPK